MGRVSVALVCASVAFGLLGAGRGLDEGLIATTVDLPSFIQQFGLNAPNLSATERANRLSNITSLMHLGSILGAVVAFLLNNWIGPLWTMRQLCVVWVCGVIVTITSAGNYGQLIASRLIIGLGVGQAGVICPNYLAEVAPSDNRGFLVGMYSLSEYIGIVIGYFAGYGASIHLSNVSSAQWIIPQSIQIILSGILFAASFGCVESPRHLCRTGRVKQAAQALASLQGLGPNEPQIMNDLQSIQSQTYPQEDSKAKQSLLQPWITLFGRADNRFRLMFLTATHLLAQWSGTNAITTYAPHLFDLLEVNIKSEGILRTAIFGIVKLASAIISAVFFIDRAGRRRCLLFGISLQVLSLCYVAIFLTVRASHEFESESRALRGASIAALVSVYVTGIGYAFGWNCVQFLINSEIFSSQVRALGTSILMCFHFANRFALLKALPSMLLSSAMQPQGTFWFFFAIAFLGLLWVALLFPETSHKTLEQTSETDQFQIWSLRYHHQRHESHSRPI